MSHHGGNGERPGKAMRCGSGNRHEDHCMKGVKPIQGVFATFWSFHGAVETCVDTGDRKALNESDLRRAASAAAQEAS